MIYKKLKSQSSHVVYNYDDGYLVYKEPNTLAGKILFTYEPIAVEFTSFNYLNAEELVEIAEFLIQIEEEIESSTLIAN